MAKRLKELLDNYFSRRTAPYWCVLLADCFIVLFSGIASFFLLYGVFRAIGMFWPAFIALLLIIPGYLLGFRIFHTYSGILRYSSSSDFIRVGGAMMIGFCVSLVINFVFGLFLPEKFTVRVTILMLTAVNSTLMSVVMRLLVKYFYDNLVYTSDKERIFIYGVHEGGDSIARTLQNDKDTNYVLYGFVTDEPQMVQHRMFGVRVYLNDETLLPIMKQKHVHTLFVSPLRSDALRANQKFLDELVQNGIKIMMQSGEQEWDGKSPLETSQLHEVEIEDLLPREKIEVNLDAIAELLRDRTVLITGAAGSIGYEMVRQVAKFSPRQLILVDQAETPMHNVRLHMAAHYPYVRCETIVTTICNASKMERLFKRYRPDYVFHAAAYKHVPMMEDNPSEAVQNNIYGTRVIADLAVKYGTKKFVMISTDKAVNPTNVMGCSKRICEIYCQSLNAEIRKEGTLIRKWNGEPADTQFVTTRFGNVLGSNGSVIPIFRKQIKQGGPITVTHPDIIRFFMLIPEACRLVLEAGTMGNGGEIFVFDMGKPVRIADLAQRMIDLSGAHNVKIQYTGLRDGEKLYEEVLNDEENTRPTPHPKIMVAAVREYDYALACQNEEDLLQMSYTYDDMKIVAKMKEIVPEYKSQHSKYEALDVK